ncbi:hypothetical protein B0T22DRAFT_440341 [Podospora appendiculata]|uniref:TauD/TfdA-like domain-containing protein n=1 Tax=Podospora appendiculata TaxID=314037 RepID=A0AAE1CCS3_9PEZI|nr:hypothetical protein B0T22DRAFT_440341 [Podospora appendiculata]
MAIYAPGQNYALPVPVLAPEDELYYSPTNFRTGPSITEDVPSPMTYSQRLENIGHLLRTQPKQYPAEFPDASIVPWSGGDPDTDPEAWIFQLQPEDIAEIDAALKGFSGPKIKALWDDAVNHDGILILRGLDPKRYSLHQNIVLYVGITSYVSVHRAAQTITNDLLVHLRDSGIITGESQYRREQFSGSAQPFHTDFAPIMAMYVVETPLQGGRCMWASGLRVYQELVASRPEVIEVLESVDDHGNPLEAITPRPVLYWDDGHPFFFFSRRQLTGTPLQARPQSIPQLTDLQADALDAVQFAALKHCIRHVPVRGEIQVIDNLAILHSREQFVNGQGRDRHLIRLWLKNEQLAHKTLHVELQKVFNDVFRPDRLKESIWELRGYNSWETLVDESGHSNT